MVKKKTSKRVKKSHKKTFTKSKKIYAKEKFNLSIKEFVLKWKKRYQRKVKEMYISELKII